MHESAVHNDSQIFRCSFAITFLAAPNGKNSLRETKNPFSSSSYKAPARVVTNQLQELPSRAREKKRR